MIRDPDHHGFSRRRRRYLHWLFEAKKRFGLSVLNYAVTPNHSHLLVKDTGGDVIPRRMQLVAARTPQEFKAPITESEMHAILAR